MAVCENMPPFFLLKYRRKAPTEDERENCENQIKQVKRAHKSNMRPKPKMQNSQSRIPTVRQDSQKPRHESQ